MTPYVVVFWLMLPGVALAAWRWGGRPEREAALLYLVAAVATLLARGAWTGRYAHVEWTVLIVDAVLLAGLTIIMMKADRWWPMLATALQAVSTLSHVAKAMNPTFWQLGYAIMSGASSYPTLLILGFAIWHNRAERNRTTSLR